MSPYGKYSNVFGIVFLACGAIFSYSCKQINHNGRPFVVTQNNIKALKIVIIDLNENDMRDLKKSEGLVLPVSEFILDPSIGNEFFLDGWKHPLKCKISQSIFFLWSVGPNGIDEQGTGDDIGIRFSTEEMFMYKVND